MAQVVFVDDDEKLLAEIRGAFEGEGWSVQATDSPEREHVKIRPRPAVILIDLDMPLMDGDVLCSFLIHEWGVKSPIYLYSSHTEEELKARWEGSGAAGYVCKSWGIERLVEIVRGLIEG